MTAPGRVVARRLVADRRGGAGWWAAGLVALVVLSVAFFPTLRAQESFDEVMRDLPEAMRSMFGIEEAIPVTSAPGYLQGRLFSLLAPLLLIVFGIGAGSRVIAGSEEDGTLELVLSTPATRRQVALGRYAASVGLLAGLTLVLAVSVLATAPPFGALEGVSVPGLLAACAGAGALALLHLTVAFTVGAATGRRAPAAAAATVLAVTGYLVQGLAAVSDVIHPLRLVSPWHWYLGRNMLVQGVAPEAFVVPVALSAALLLVAIVAFERRDLR